MINFYHNTTIPTTEFVDLINQSKKYPSFTLMTRTNYRFGLDGDEEGEDSGWINVVLDVPEITKELAEKTLADHLHLAEGSVKVCDIDF